MHLMHIDISKLGISALNMRDGKKPPDVSDILPSVRARGILVPLLVRANGSPETFEIVAGRRRYHAAKAVSEESGLGFELPCAVMDEADDAAALEASLLENFAREQPHEVELWESFTRLVKEGRSPEEVALTFSMTARQVEQILALGNLLPKLRELYAKEEIDAASIRLLTMASKAQQKDWLKQFADPKAYAPTGMRLKAWLFGGASIPTTHAIFDLSSYKGEIVSDLFGEESYFASADLFWEAQRAAIEEKRQAYLGEGWADVVVLEPGTYFHSWDHEKTPKTKGGKVFIAIGARREVAFHEGYLTRAEARRKANGQAAEEKPHRAELTASLQSYLDLHRHAAVRNALLGYPTIALRLMAAHCLSGSSLFSVRADPRRAPSDAIAESAETAVSETRFDAERRRLLDLLGLDGEASTLIHGYGSHGGPDGTAGLFLKLLHLSDSAVMEVVALAMGEALEAGSLVVEVVGLHLGVDMSKVWSADDAFFSLLRDREVLLQMIAELAGSDVAKANATEKTAGLKAIIADCLKGANGREQVHGWVPRWMAFPPRPYTARGGVGTVSRFRQIEALLSVASGEAQTATVAEGEAPATGPEAQAIAS